MMTSLVSGTSWSILPQGSTPPYSGVFRTGGSGNGLPDGRDDPAAGSRHHPQDDRVGGRSVLQERPDVHGRSFEPGLDDAGGTRRAGEARRGADTGRRVELDRAELVQGGGVRGALRAG